jgi:uncharacterized protein (DUF1697 family)
MKYIAFLRAINVSGRNVKMDLLKDLFEKSGFSNVETFIASGNVIFNSPAKDIALLEKKIENALRSDLGFDVSTFIRTPGELEEIAVYKPFKTKGEALNISFIKSPLSADATARLMNYKSDIDDFHIRGCEIYWQCLKKQSESKFSNAVLERAIQQPSTLRGLSTIQKMAEKYAKGN